MLEIIKSVRICDTYNLSLIYLVTAKGYEVQYSDDEEILETDGTYSTKRNGIVAFNQFLKRLVKEVEV